ncbi:Phosphate transport system permease protein PstA [Anoxybacillus sp. BCO1]|nr:Phosphate transport system permease protein PstA [Anoxybacillus sp. BCO1]
MPCFAHSWSWNSDLLRGICEKNRFTDFIQTNISNLAGVPSIVFGLLGLTLFVRELNLGRSVLAAGLTMSLLVLPVIVVAAQEAIRAVPNQLREASYGMGATKWQTIYGIVLPAAIPGILTGSILALSRAIGETAPLVVLGIPTFLAYLPRGILIHLQLCRCKFITGHRVHKLTSKTLQQLESLSCSLC